MSPRDHAQLQAFHGILRERRERKRRNLSGRFPHLRALLAKQFLRRTFDGLFENGADNEGRGPHLASFCDTVIELPEILPFIWSGTKEKEEEEKKVVYVRSLGGVNNNWCEKLVFHLAL